MKLIWKLAIPQICIVVCIGLISYAVISSSFHRTREEHVRDVLEFRIKYVFDQIDVNSRKSVHETSLFLRLPAVLEAYKIALKSENAYDRENPDPYAPEYQKAREHLRKELKPLLESYEAIADKRIELHFHLPNGLSLARMWRDPATGENGTGNDGRGKDISDDLRSFRFTILHALDTGETTLGLEAGSGGFAIRGVIPVIDPGSDELYGTADDTLLGSAEVLQQFNPILEAATQEGKVYVSIYANKELTRISPELDNPEKYPPNGEDFIRIIAAKDASVEALITPELLSKGKNASDTLFEDHSHMNLAVRRIVDFEGKQVGVIIAAMNTATVTSYANTASIITALMIAGMAIVPIFVLLLRLRYLVSRPLNMVKAKIQDIAEDRMDLTEQIPCDQKDEIGELAKWFNTLTAKLDGILKERQAILAKIHDESDKFKAMAHWYGSILDSIPFLVSVQDVDLKWTFVNSALEKILDKKREDLIGLPCSTWGVSICNTDNCAINCAKNGRKQTYFSHDGMSYQVDVAILKDLHGEITGFIEVIQDVTEIENLTEQQAEAQAASQAKSSFLANMSHEIRTPLNAIVGMTSIGMSATDPERMKYCFAKIEDASRHLLGVINNILDISKIEAGKFELAPVEFNFEKMLQRVVNVVNYRVDEKKQKLTVYIDRKIPAFLFGDDQRLAQVITNLLGNAVKFTPERGVIKINTYYLGEENGVCTIKLAVRDTGIGISPEQQARLFQSYNQAEASTSRKFGGTGLGLVISKSIVEMMNGEMSIESEAGKGSVFSFTIQVKRGEKKQEPYRAKEMNWEKLRVLIVDDESYILEDFKGIVEGFGASCDAAADATEALKLVEQGGYNIYFIDWMLPDIDGIELARQLKTKKLVEDDSLMVLISSAELSTIVVEAKETGIDKFLQKPLFPSAIMDIISEYLGLMTLQPKENNKDTNGIYSGRHILLAEDVEINREIIQTLLEPTKLGIDYAENGVEAVRMFSEAPDKYEMIFMDVQMPEMDGYEATQHIRALDIPKAKTIPIIAMTANVFREDIEKCLDAGMNGHIGKPIDMDNLFDKLNEYLERV